jgi:chemotaxis protein MotB
MGKSKEKSASWLVTYSDMVTLLMSFFLVLWILSPGVTSVTYDTIIDLFEEQTGLLEAANKSPQSNSETPTPERIVDYIEQTRAAWQELADVVKEANVTEQMDLEFQHPDKVLITLNDSLTFNSGSDVLLPLAELVLNSVANVIKAEQSLVEVQGHTDSVPIYSEKFNSNWHLGAARAVTVVQYLVNASDMPSEEFKASSYGENKPVDTNLTAEGRLQNRRVEIYIRKEWSMVERYVIEEMFEAES